MPVILIMIRLKQINRSINTTGSGDIDNDVKNLSDLIETLFNKMNKLELDFNIYVEQNDKNIELIQTKINQMVAYINAHP